MKAAFETAWSDFLEEIRSSRERLRSDISAIASELSATTEKLTTAYAELALTRPERGRIASLEQIYSEYASTLLDPAWVKRATRVPDRLSRTFEDHRHSLTDSARKLPARAEVSAEEVVSALVDDTELSTVLRFYRWSNRRRTVPVRSVIVDALDGERWRSRRGEGAVHIAVSQQVLALIDPWRQVRDWLLGQLREEEFDESRLDRGREQWKQAVGDRQQAFEQAMRKLGDHFERQDMRLSELVVDSVAMMGFSRSFSRARQWQDAVAFWGRTGRAVAATLKAERAVADLGAQASERARQTIDELSGERKEILDELTEAIRSLRNWSADGENPLPDPTAHLIGSRERVGRWKSAMTSEVRSHIPDRVELAEPRRPLPGWRTVWRTVHPQEDFLSALDSASETVADAFAPIEADHKALVTEIERAREVVGFSLQVRAEDRVVDYESSPQLASESVSNAASLLEHQRDNLEARIPAAEAGLVAATTATFHQYHVAFEEGGITLWSYIAREGVARGTRQLVREALALASRSGRQLVRFVGRQYHRLLVSIGWEAPLESGLAPVERWGYWDTSPSTEVQGRLPLIYERLFRSQPVEDPRFLIGREPEMAALTEARNAWKAGRGASVLIVGQRGSGKTSLLNCATIQAFGNDSPVRASFSDRILTPEDLRFFLASRIGFAPDDLIEAMSVERVVMLEEVSRTFLRTVGGLEATRELLRIVAETSGRTLWILSVSLEAFRFLNSATGLARPFSHVINASSVEPDQLREAILQRHHLSGLRLVFDPPPEPSRFRGWFRRASGIVESAEESFFNTLYRQSGGVYRSAFQLWRRQMNRVEGGVLYMRHPTPVAIGPLTQGLDDNALFTLQMIVQHGSLEPDEHARIFGCSPGESRGLLKRLSARGILEPDTAGPGMRIRPSVGTLVRSALNAKNLI